MTPETAKALEGSIKKWEKIVAGTGRDKGASNCPLCRMFLMTNCGGCPVRGKTGWVRCRASPHEEWCAHNEDEHASDGFCHLHCPDCIRLATAELEFLKSLREDG